MPGAPAIPKNAFAKSANWTRKQLKLTFYFYCQTPFGKLHSRNPEIVELAELIGRTPDASAMKLVNFASLDPSITSTGRRGLSGSSLDREIWDEFHNDWERLAVESEQIRDYLRRQHHLPANSSAVYEVEIGTTDFTGETRQVVVQQRIKQQFFRRAVLSSYRSRCCISGVSDARLLVASHIVPWSEDKLNRLNPSNGLCLTIGNVPVALQLQSTSLWPNFSANEIAPNHARRRMHVGSSAVRLFPCSCVPTRFYDSDL